MADELIRDYDPLKQGLKLAYGGSEYMMFVIRDYDPLKQGLKQGYSPRS